MYQIFSGFLLLLFGVAAGCRFDPSGIALFQSDSRAETSQQTSPSHLPDGQIPKDVAMIHEGMVDGRQTPVPDAIILDQGAAIDLEGEGPAKCSPSGIAMGCDPIQNLNCPAGSCYVVKNNGPSCVCPAGGKGLGDSCSTTIECHPGSICIGWEPPGVCMQLCIPGKVDCPSSEKCTPIKDLSSFGFCHPK